MNIDHRGGAFKTACRLFFVQYLMREGRRSAIYYACLQRFGEVTRYTRQFTVNCHANALLHQLEVEFALGAAMVRPGGHNKEPEWIFFFFPVLQQHNSQRSAFIDQESVLKPPRCLPLSPLLWLCQTGPSNTFFLYGDNYMQPGRLAELDLSCIAPWLSAPEMDAESLEFCFFFFETFSSKLFLQHPLLCAKMQQSFDSKGRMSYVASLDMWKTIVARAT